MTTSGATAVVFVIVGAIVGCGESVEHTATSPSTPTSAAASAAAPATSTDSGQQFPEIVDAAATRSGATWTFEVTVSSPYDTPQRYADGWRVLGPDLQVYGEHTLTHDHAAEQPFTRTQEGVEIPDVVQEVTIEGHDLVNGYGGTTATIQLESP